MFQNKLKDLFVSNEHVFHFGEVSSIKNDVFRSFRKGVTDLRTYGPTDLRTYGPTDLRTDRPSYRDARTHLKISPILITVEYR